MESASKVNVVSYQYMANKKSYVLGLRVRNIKWVLIGSLGLLAFLGPYTGSIILVIYGIVGYNIDLKQREMTRNYTKSVLAWRKIGGLEVSDTNEGVLSVFKK